MVADIRYFIKPEGLECHIISPFSGKENSMLLPITESQFDDWFFHGGLIQNVMPNLTPDQREFLISGITPEEWNDIFGPSPDSDEE